MQAVHVDFEFYIPTTIYSFILNNLTPLSFYMLHLSTVINLAI